MKKDGCETLAGAKLGMESLYKHILGCEIEGIIYTNSKLLACLIQCYYIGAHRALPDILAMERVLTHPSLASCLSELPIRSPLTQKKLWVDQKNLHLRTTRLVRSLGKPAVTSLQAKKLDSLGLGYDELLQLKSRSKGKESFLETLKDKGVNSKPLREKLATLLRC